ncbi:hypothetical protein F9L33_10135 [Amylibacter sp. SFDW26]|uniref:hypothetical protein n=1 Tax=Amylibacter sp. SFDW26 TaxID=2652722 RepID=UPI0012617F89|nr:hypothetical protein [Amylibacter sp. SFDW26]KAB7613723.1 hypothetical protein F9L33_10135 [Amylibacter sp. SFDW26]
MPRSIIDDVLSINEPEQYSEIQNVETLFHNALEQNQLKQILEKFPLSEHVYNFIFSQVLNYEQLKPRWEEELLNEINTMINLLPPGKLSLLNKFVLGEVNYDTDEMFTLRGEMGKVIRKRTIDNISAHERAFLNDFFFGVDFTHWSKWSIMFQYTKIEFSLPNILLARRNGVDFCIDGQVLILGKQKC